MTLVAPITRVELFEDRAALTRSVQVPGPGRHTLTIEGVTPLMDERSLVFPGDGVVVEEARVRRWVVTQVESDAESATTLEARRLELIARLRSAEAAVTRSAEAAKHAEQTLEAGFATLPRLLHRDDPARGASAVRALAQARADAIEAACGPRLALDDLRRELADVERRLALARGGRSTWRAQLVLNVFVPEASTARQLVVRCTVPCAVWRPSHRATLKQSANGLRVAWEVGAVVWNGTGEDWKGVELVCSTARPGERSDPPVLTDDALRSRRKDPTVVVNAREEVVEVARHGASRRAPSVPGVEDGGEPRTFTAPRPVDVPSDGRPVGVRLETWETDASGTYVAHPEQSAAVVLRTRQHNAGSRPLLAGPVQLFREVEGRAFAVGRGRVGFVAPNEPFLLGWGSHDGARVTRSSTRNVERARLTGWQTWTFQTVVRVVNLGGEPVTVELKERVPMSEIGDVKVGRPTSRPAADHGPDVDGMLAWHLVVEPGGRRELTIEFSVEAASSVQLPF